MKEIRERVELFASLQAAQRALARSIHPSALEPVAEAGRDVLLQLQALSELTSKPDVDPGSDALEAGLEQVDRLLHEQTQRTLAILSGLELSQLRATVPLLSVQHPEEVSGLIDIIMAGDLEDDKFLRTLEYLVTMVSVEERDGRRVVVREPSQVAPKLAAVSQEKLAEPDTRDVVAEKLLTDAVTELVQGKDLGSMRDRVRLYKEDLGSRLLHPRTLAAAVKYNVAMWNQVAARIDNSRSIDQLAEELISTTVDSAGGSGSDEHSDVLGSLPFARIMSTLSVRMRGDKVPKSPEGRIVAALQLDTLCPGDTQAFDADADPEDPVNALTRKAVTLGLIIRQREDVEDSLAALSIDPDALETQCLDELMGDLTEHARKLFSDSRYAEAFKLSEVKTRNLSPIAVSRRQREEGDDGDRPRRRASRGRRAWWDLGFAPSAAVVVLGLIPLLIGLAIWSPSPADPGTVEVGLQEISPFLESGHKGTNEGKPRFTGRVGRTWSYLGPEERRVVASEIGEHFDRLGIYSVVLIGQDGQIVAQYEHGTLKSVFRR